MITEKHSKETILQLEILGWLILIGEAVVSISFQLLYATTRIEQVVAVIYGIGIPLATVAFLKLAIIFNDKRFVFASFGLWALLFFWGWHTQYSYLLDETSSKADSSKVALVQNEQLSIIEEKLKNMPIVGAVFNDSIDKKIAAVEIALSKCPSGHATACINPNQEKLQRLYSERDSKGVQAQIKNERNELLTEKQRALNAMSGTDADIENAKTMAVYRGISWMINKLGGNYSPKEAEYLASIIGTFLYTVLSCTVWGFRTKFIMERESGGYIHSPTLPTNNHAKVNDYVNSARENVSAIGQSMADKFRAFKQHQNQVNALSNADVSDLSERAYAQRESHKEPVPVYERGHSESLIQKPFIGFVDTNTLPKAR
jgi:hypothetical protein